MTIRALYSSLSMLLLYLPRFHVFCASRACGPLLPGTRVAGRLCSRTCVQSAHSPLLRMAAEDGVFKVVRWLFSRLPDTLQHPTVPEETNAPVVEALAASPPKKSHVGVRGSVGKDSQQPLTEALAGAGGNSCNTEQYTGSPAVSPRSARRPDQGAGTAGCGLPCVVKVFGFLCSQLLRRGGGGGAGGGVSSLGGGGSAPTPRRVLCLRLMRTVLAAAGPTLALYPPLLDMVRDDLFFALIHLVQGRWVCVFFCSEYV